MNYHLRLFIRHFLLWLTLAFFMPCLADELNESAPINNVSTIPLAEKNYARLQEILPLYREAMLHPWPIVPATHKVLKSGMRNLAVLALRERLKATHDLPQYYERPDYLFDAELAQAVKHFQQRNGLQADGVVGKRTLQELNVPPEVRVKQIELNIQRWAALMPQLHDRFILVNIPEYELYVYDNNSKVLNMKAIMGKPITQTPELQSQVVRIVFNPYWNIPAKIGRNEIVKKMQKDPSYLDNQRIRILKGDENNSPEIDQSQIDWQRAAKSDHFPYRFRQDPGLDNALGIVKFEFQNSHDIYMHDTPAKELFDQDTRALSHGCIRLENPLGLVDYLMDGSPTWNEEKMQDALNQDKPKYVRAYRPIPIIIAYLTAWVDDNGVVNFRNDIYGKDY